MVQRSCIRDGGAQSWQDALKSAGQLLRTKDTFHVRQRDLSLKVWRLATPKVMLYSNKDMVRLHLTMEQI